MGLLTGTLGPETRFAAADFRASETRFAPENLAHNLALVDVLRRWAERKQATPAQLALAWLLAQRPWVVPIPGTTQMEHLLENVGAAAVSLTNAELVALTAEASAVSIQGERLPPQVQAYSDVEAPPKR